MQQDNDSVFLNVVFFLGEKLLLIEIFGVFFVVIVEIVCLFLDNQAIVM